MPTRIAKSSPTATRPRHSGLHPRFPQWRYAKDAANRLNLPKDLAEALELIWREADRAAAIASLYRDRCFDPQRRPTLEAASARLIFNVPAAASAYALVEREVLLAAAFLGNRKWRYDGEKRQTAHAAALLFCERMRSALCPHESEFGQPRSRQLLLQRRRIIALPDINAAEIVDAMKSESVTAAQRRRDAAKSASPPLLPPPSDIEKLKRAIEHLALNPNATKHEVAHVAGYGEGYFSRKGGQRKWEAIRTRAVHIRKGFRRMTPDSRTAGDVDAIDEGDEE